MNKRIAIASTIAALVLTANIGRAQTTTEQTPAPMPTEDAVETSASEGANEQISASAASVDVNQQVENQLLTSDLIGAEVYNLSSDPQNPTEQNIGEIDRLVIDQEGQVVAAVLSVGGFLGIGDKLVGVSWEDLMITAGELGLHVRTSLNKEQLEQAPYYKTQAQLKSKQLAEEARQRTQEAAEPIPQ